MPFKYVLLIVPEMFKLEIFEKDDCTKSENPCREPRRE